MARVKVTHSDDAVQITFNGDKRNPEPATGVIKFPGGHVEVSRCSDGTYWAHVEVVDAANVVASRVDYDRAGWIEHGIPEIPAQERIAKLAIRVANNVPHFDPNT